jgi:hypothetical protein
MIADFYFLLSFFDWRLETGDGRGLKVPTEASVFKSLQLHFF